MLGRVNRDAHLLGAIGAPSLRVDVGLGWDHPPQMPGVFGKVVEASAGRLAYDMAPIDNYTAALAEVGVTPVYAWCYTPSPLQIGGDWKSGPADLAQWTEIHRRFGAALAGTGAVHELYNEPDGPWFLTANWTRYLAMAEAAAAGLREGDNTATIIGPAAAIPTVDRIGSFLDMVDKAGLPLAAVSIHACTDPDAAALGRSEPFALLHSLVGMGPLQFSGCRSGSRPDLRGRSNPPSPTYHHHTTTTTTSPGWCNALAHSFARLASHSLFGHRRPGPVEDPRGMGPGGAGRPVGATVQAPDPSERAERGGHPGDRPGPEAGARRL